MKTRTLMRAGIYLVLILFLLLVAILVWPQKPPAAEVISQRGLKAPPGFKIPTSRSNSGHTPIGSPRGWIDQGLDSLAHWHDNPLGIHPNSWGQHLWELKHSKDPKDQEEYQRLLALAKTWRDNLLTRYPELKVKYRDIPDDKNALKLLFDLQKRLTREDGTYGPDVPDNLREQLANKQPWDATAAQAWIDANRGTLDELRAISKMPDSSIKDCGEGYLLLAHGGAALLIDARLAADRGDYAASLESLRAVRGLAAILHGSEAPPRFHQMIGANMQSRLRDCVFQSIMPAVPAGEMDLAAWENLLKPEVQTPADFSRTAKGEWNFGMQYELLPALADPAETQSPDDAEAFVEAYTNHLSTIVSHNENLALTDLPSNPDSDFDTSDLSWRSRKLVEFGLTHSYRDAWQRHQINTGMTQAAFAILRGQPVPNDPIYGKPYKWNPETRELSRPAGPEFKNMGTKPLIVPKL